jgi:hypothetical protein
VAALKEFFLVVGLVLDDEYGGERKRETDDEF